MTELSPGRVEETVGELRRLASEPWALTADLRRIMTEAADALEAALQREAKLREGLAAIKKQTLWLASGHRRNDLVFQHLIDLADAIIALSDQSTETGEVRDG